MTTVFEVIASWSWQWRWRLYRMCFREAWHRGRIWPNEDDALVVCRHVRAAIWRMEMQLQASLEREDRS